MALILGLLWTGLALAGKCPAINGTFEGKQDYGSSALTVHVKRGKISRDGEHWYPADGSFHVEKDENFGDSRISFECKGGALLIHQDLVKTGQFISDAKKLPAKGLLKVKPRGKNIYVEASGDNPLVKMVKGGVFTRKK